MKILDPYDIVDTDDRTYCWHHDQFEEHPGTFYRICGECHHVYLSAADLVEAFNVEGRAMAEKWDELLMGSTVADVRVMTVDEADHIGFCQFCLHDW